MLDLLLCRRAINLQFTNGGTRAICTRYAQFHRSTGCFRQSQLKAIVGVSRGLHFAKQLPIADHFEVARRVVLVLPTDDSQENHSPRLFEIDTNAIKFFAICFIPIGGWVTVDRGRGLTPLAPEELAYRRGVALNFIRLGRSEVSGLIDFGDMAHGR